jgi:hypothetical protein
MPLDYSEICSVYLQASKDIHYVDDLAMMLGSIHQPQAPEIESPTQREFYASCKLRTHLKLEANRPLLEAFGSRFKWSDICEFLGAAPMQEAPREEPDLASRVLEKRSSTSFEPDVTAIADASVADALTMLRRAVVGGSPRVMFSDDGTLTIQWQRGDHGVALIFAGDGLASVVFRRPGQLYAENGIEVPVSDPLPAEFLEVLAEVLA